MILKKVKNKIMDEEKINPIDQTDQQQEETTDQTTSATPEEDLQKKCNEYLDGWKRSKADLINYKKDENKRFESFLKFSNEQIIRDLLVILDSFDLALASLGGESKIEKGIYLIRAQFEDVLKKYGLERLSVSVGQKFDPLVHDAIASIEEEGESGTVFEEVEKGYMLNGKLIRASRVKVIK